MHLGVGEQHRELGTGEAEKRRAPRPQRLAIGQAFERAVEESVRLELDHHLAELREAGRAAVLIARDGAALTPVVGEHERGDVVGELVEQRVPRRRRHDAARDQRREGDLEVHLVVGRVDAGGVVDGVGVDAAAGERDLDASALREAEIAALADDPGAELARVDPHRRVDAVADLGVGLALRLHVGADAAVEEEVGRHAQHRLDQLIAVDGFGGDAEHRTRLGREPDGLGAAADDHAAAAQEVGTIVGPARARRARRGARARRTTSPDRGRGRGRRDDGRTPRAGARVRERKRPLPKTSPLMSPMPVTVNGSLCDVTAVELAEVQRHALPGAARRDAHLLVVVALRPARGEGVAEPEAVLGRDGVGDVGKRRRALVGGDDEIRDRARRDRPRWRAGRRGRRPGCRSGRAGRG